MEFLSLSCRQATQFLYPFFAPFLQGGAVLLTLKAYSVHCWLGHFHLVSLFQLRLILKPKMPFKTDQFINSVDFCATFLCVIFCKVVLCHQY